MLQQESTYSVIIVSGDRVFTALMHTLLKQFLKDADILQIHSFNAIRDLKQLDRCNLMLLGDLVDGARGLEVLEYLRVKKQFAFPIAFFCDDVDELKRTALRRGSNYCYTRPLKPDRIVLDLLQKTVPQENEGLRL